MLQIENLSVSFGGAHALNSASLDVAAGEFVALVGPNGAGKTTLFRAISGVVPLAAGRILYDGQDLARVAPSQRPALGIAHVPEGRQVFPRLTVLENLEMGAQTAAARRDWRQTQDLVFGLFPRLHERRSQAAGTLSGGEQQMLAVSRALMLRPRLLLLDEPSFGLAPRIVQELFEIFRAINQQDRVSMLLVEQNAALALKLADQAYLLETGRVVISGTAEAIRSDEAIRRSYLGY